MNIFILFIVFYMIIPTYSLDLNQTWNLTSEKEYLNNIRVSIEKEKQAREDSAFNNSIHTMNKLIEGQVICPNNITFISIYAEQLYNLNILNKTIEYMRTKGWNVYFTHKKFQLELGDVYSGGIWWKECTLSYEYRQESSLCFATIYPDMGWRRNFFSLKPKKTYFDWDTCDFPVPVIVFDTNPYNK